MSAEDSKNKNPSKLKRGKDGMYWEEGDNDPFCPLCFEDEKKEIHLLPVKGSPWWDCPLCRTQFDKR